MKSILSLVALSTIAFTTNAYTLPALNTIYGYITAGKTYTDANGNPYKAYQPWEFLLGYAMGTQADITSTSTTCYGQVTQTYTFIDEIAVAGYSALNHILSADFSYVSSDVQTITQYFNNLVIQLSDQIIACQDAVKIKQLSTRTSKLSGATNWLFTIVYGIFFDQVKVYLPSFLQPQTNQKIGSSAYAIYNIVSTYVTNPSVNRIEINEFGKQIGLFISEVLEAKVVSYVPLVEAQKLS